MRCIGASAERWARARFPAPFHDVAGCAGVVRRVLQRSETWDSRTQEEFSFLCAALEAREQDQPFLRAVSANSLLASSELDSGPLRKLTVQAASMAAQGAVSRRVAGLRTLAAVSAAGGIARRTIRNCLSLKEHGSPLIRGAAMRAAGWCFRSTEEYRHLFDEFEKEPTDVDAMVGLATLIHLREDALESAGTQRLELWCVEILRAIHSVGTASDQLERGARAVELLAALLRGRFHDPDFLAPDSELLAAACRTAILSWRRHQGTCGRHAKLFCACLTRYVRYLSGQGSGDVLWNIIDREGPTLEDMRTPQMPHGVRPATTQVVPEPGAEPECGGSAPQPSHVPPSPPRVFESDESQRAVIEAPADSFLVVTAPPGAGKTAVACARIAWLAKQGIAPSRILMISFTRVAVQIFRERIRALAPDVPDIEAVEVTTLDSHAWHLLRGLGGKDTAELLSAGYEQNIEATCQSIRSGSGDICEWLGNHEHIVVDEAQDLVGPRAELVVAILENRSMRCGATVFGDEAQAIYGFTSDVGRGDGIHEGLDFFQRLQISSLQPERRALENIHRTDRDNLKRLFLEAREPIGDQVAEPEQVFGRTRERILAQADGQAPDWETFLETLGPRNALVLFRSRAQVLKASDFLLGLGIPHRLRLSRTPHVIAPWIGLLLGNSSGSLLLQSEFEELWQAQAGHPCLRVTEHDMEGAWNALREVAPNRKRNGVDLHRLRFRLSRKSPPVLLSTTEVGFGSATLGTIHASKGREADDVVLWLPGTPRQGKDNRPRDLREEARVLYVGATRAIQRLEIGQRFSAAAVHLGKRRAYWKLKKGGRQVLVEIGMESDLDAAATISQSLMGSEAACAETQSWLACHADHLVPVTARMGPGSNSRYWITEEGGRALGLFHRDLETDLKNIAHFAKIPSARLPITLPDLHMIGVTTVALTNDDPRLGDLHEPFASSGFFLAPVVRGFRAVTFQTYTSPGSRW